MSASRAKVQRGWRDFVYCLRLMPDGTWLRLNRHYGRLGTTVDIAADFPQTGERINLTDDMLRAISHSGKGMGGGKSMFCHLYDEAHAPWTNKTNMRVYLARMAIIHDAGAPMVLIVERSEDGRSISGPCPRCGETHTHGTAGKPGPDYGERGAHCGTIRVRGKWVDFTSAAYRVRGIA